MTRLTRRIRRIPAHLRPRRFRLYGIGEGKTGTTTLARKFARYRSEHEYDGPRMTQVQTAMLNGSLTLDDARSELRRRSRRFNLDVDSAHFLTPFAGLLAELYDDARFVLLLRDCFSWIDSRIELSLRRLPTIDAVGAASMQARYGRFGDEPAAEEAPLTDAGLSPIASYLRYWSAHAERVLQAVPADRLCVVRTEDLDVSNERLARFVGVDPSTIVSVHANRNESRTGLLGRVPRELVVERAQEHCAPLMTRYWGDDWLSLAERLPHER